MSTILCLIKWRNKKICLSERKRLNMKPNPAQDYHQLEIGLDFNLREEVPLRKSKIMQSNNKGAMTLIYFYKDE